MSRPLLCVRMIAAFVAAPTILSDARPASADSSAPPGWTTSAYGARDNFERAYAAPARDPRGVRLIVNGRLIDLSSSPDGAEQRTDIGGGVIGGAGLLGGPTLTATAIGNSAEISNVSNSTIILNQTNVGPTMATAVAGGGR